MKPGTRCSICQNEFKEDDPLSSYHGTVKIAVAKTDERFEYDACKGCLAIMLELISKEKK